MKALEIKAAVRERDGHRCTECGLTQEEYRKICGKALDVHRIIPGTPYSLENAVTLCGACHSKKPKSPKGHADHVSFQLPRALVLQALGLESFDGVVASKFFLRLFRSLPPRLSKSVLEELKREQQARDLCFFADPAWVARVEKQAARFGTNLSAYIREAVTMKLEADEASDPSLEEDA